MICSLKDNHNLYLNFKNNFTTRLHCFPQSVAEVAPIDGGFRQQIIPDFFIVRDRSKPLLLFVYKISNVYKWYLKQIYKSCEYWLVCHTLISSIIICFTLSGTSCFQFGRYTYISNTHIYISNIYINETHISNRYIYTFALLLTIAPSVLIILGRISSCGMPSLSKNR